MHKGPPFNRRTGTSRYSKIFQGLTGLVTTSGLLKLLDSTYSVKAYLFKPPTTAMKIRTTGVTVPVPPASLTFPLSSTGFGRGLAPSVLRVISNPPRAPWGEWLHLPSRGGGSRGLRKLGSNGGGRFETECVQHHRLCLFHCSLMSELLFIGHLFSSRHDASCFK